jgi:hypothetical protein
VSAAQAMVAAEKGARPRRRSVLEDSLSNSGTVFHPIQHEAVSRDLRRCRCCNHTIATAARNCCPGHRGFCEHGFDCEAADAEGGSEKVLWREAHAALVKAEELGWPGGTRFVWGTPQAIISLPMRHLGRI